MTKALFKCILILFLSFMVSAAPAKDLKTHNMNEGEEDLSTSESSQSYGFGYGTKIADPYGMTSSVYVHGYGTHYDDETPRIFATVPFGSEGLHYNYGFVDGYRGSSFEYGKRFVHGRPLYGIFPLSYQNSIYEKPRYY
ncbi:unnamed protein product [Lepeophtheirus salmonis]|uniref:(salmon louse) hypothetical protein n=2 Tax=Lepeophtheirus salmonis TaxID=72036 RepID=A0A7R8GYV8_LEPSM|nr:uncharacterized protein LOC121123098 [Lepeophtheirus salmonis]CAB4054279.1 unnamed protein product [Lepeophtheirus salmonis]CAF2754668.1 unnamed protein product [Lepeophtheirus salmonis]